MFEQLLHATLQYLVKSSYITYSMPCNSSMILEVEVYAYMHTDILMYTNM